MCRNGILEEWWWCFNNVSPRRDGQKYKLLIYFNVGGNGPNTMSMPIESCWQDIFSGPPEIDQWDINNRQCEEDGMDYLLLDGIVIMRR